MRLEEQVNPAILVWARESAGLDVQDAAKKLALGDSKEASGTDKLLELERGARRPTRTQLNKIAKTYRRPLLTFYMATPPKKAPRGEDFRSTGSDVSTRDNALLDALLRDLKARQEIVRDLLEDLDEATPKSFVGSFRLADGEQSVADQVSALLDIPRVRSNWGGTPDDFFKKLRSAVEKIGVFVLLTGDLGSHHSTLSEEVFRGFAVADPIAPFIVINDHDARTARSFTLIHELVHIFLGETGVSGTPESIRDNSDVGRIEQFCNDVAGLVLLPSSFADRRPTELNNGATAATRYIESIAKTWLVSEPLVAFRLKRLGWISTGTYRELATIYAQRWASVKESTRAANQLKEGGPSYYVVKQSRLGEALVDVVRRTLRENRLTHTRAAKVLGVKPSSVEPLIRRYEKSSPGLATMGAR
ncbi:ImmA/IrrE family metallo-endopeptidase [Terriglobus albidus]|uniref:ImmA/IrrE family metallo-endopeptidase n=1 Tax=Terriglobus albidus TaxID=1592106 RepID=UPI0021DFE990|nr:ImmA/IrrE family metallo-endopeptidase [Terriglobus albidus]